MVDKAKIERKLKKKLMEDPGQRPFIPGPSLPQTLPERPAVKRCGECNHCKAPTVEPAAAARGKDQWPPGHEAEGLAPTPKNSARWSRGDV